MPLWGICPSPRQRDRDVSSRPSSSHAGQRAGGQAASASAIYTCPMHPEIRQVGPGACPICGMALEPETVTAETIGRQSRTHRHDAAGSGSRWCWPRRCSSWRWAATSLGHGSCWPDRRLGLDPVRPGDPGGAVGGLAILRSAAGPRWSRASLNMFTLIAMGVGVAWAYSVAALLAPGALPAGVPRATGGAVPVYFEAAAVITVLVLLGQVLELRAREQTSGAIRPCSTWPRRPRGACATTGPTRTSPSTRSGRRPPARAAGREGPGRWRD